MPRNLEGSAARKVYQPERSLQEAKKRARKFEVIEGEGQNPHTTPDADKMLELVTQREKDHRQEQKDPNQIALKAIRQFETVQAMARQSGSMNLEALEDAVNALRDAKTMMEGRQQFLRASDKPNQQEIDRNWGLIQSLEHALERATGTSHEETPEAKQSPRAAKAERAEAATLKSQLETAKADLRQIVESFKAEYGMTPEELEEKEIPEGLMARMKHWLLTRRAEDQMVLWRTAVEKVSKTERKFARRSIAVPKIEEPKPEPTEPPQEQVIAEEKISVEQQAAALKKADKPAQRERELSNIGLEVLKPMSISEAQGYVPQAEALWNLIQEKIDAMDTDVKAKKKLMNALNASQAETDDLPATKFVFDIGRLLKAQKMGADASTLNTIERRVNAAASALGIQDNALFQSVLAYRPEAVKDVLKGKRSRAEEVTRKNAR